MLSQKSTLRSVLATRGIINELMCSFNFGNSVKASNARFYPAYNFLMSLTEISITEHNLRSSVSFHDGNRANFRHT